MSGVTHEISHRCFELFISYTIGIYSADIADYMDSILLLGNFVFYDIFLFIVCMFFSQVLTNLSSFIDQ